MSYQDLLTYWNHHHIAGRIPSRSDIDPPLDIPKLLPNLMLIDVIKGRFRLRLIGTEIGRDDTGKMIDTDLTSEPGVPVFLGFLQKVVATQAPVFFKAGSGMRLANSTYGILLPLIDVNSAVTQILAGIFLQHDRTSQKSEMLLPDSITEFIAPEI